MVILMATNTDAMWNERLKDIMPDNFMTNISDEFVAGANQIISDLINRIGRTYITTPGNFNNPFDRWTGQVMDYGDTIQDIFVPIDAGMALDELPEEPNPFATKWTKPVLQYAKYNKSWQYKNTINYDQLKMAFSNAGTFGSFSGAILEAVYKGSGLDRFTSWKKYLSQQGYVDTDNGIGVLNGDDAEDYAYAVMTTLKDVVLDKLRFPSDKYNKRGVINNAPTVDVIMTTKTKNLIDNYLAGVFNMDMLKTQANFIYIDDFATLPSAEGENDQLDVVILDSGMCEYVPRTPQTGSLVNPENLYVNYWYTEQGTYRIDLTKNAYQIYKAVTP